MDKSTLRETVLNRRKLISTEEAREKSGAITSLVLGSVFFRDARSIFCYISVDGEPDTSGILLSAFSAGKTVYVPRTGKGTEMEAVVVCEETYETARQDWPLAYGIPVPPASFPSANAPGLDLVLVPSLALDIYGHRLGHGAGFYDKFISGYTQGRERPLFAAIQFSDFLTEDPLPREDHDHRVDLIVTDKGIFTPFSS